MDIHPLSGEVVEIIVRLNAGLVRDIDSMVKAFQKKSRNQFINDMLEEWYRCEADGRADSNRKRKIGYEEQVVRHALGGHSSSPNLRII